MRTRLIDCRNSRIPLDLDMCSTDTRIPGYLNEAVMRLLPRGQWRGTTVRYQCCVNSNCLTWPRQIESIEAFAICDEPGVIRSHWYEFLGYGPGLQSSNQCSGLQLKDRGLACAFDDVPDTGNRLKIYADLAEDDNVEVLVQGWDENGNWILTDGGDTNGETIALSGIVGVTTLSKFLKGGFTGFQKPVTKGPVRVYSWNPTTGVQVPLAIYEPDETVPEYRRSEVPGLSDMGTCASSTSACTKKKITVLAKLKFIPVINDTDYLLIGCLPALIDMCQSIKARRDRQFDDAKKLEMSAVAELERELSNFHGDGTSDPLANINSTTLEGVTSLI